MEDILLIGFGICVFMFCVYFTRWVFGIDQIIKNQKEQTNLLKNIAENIKKLANSDVEKQNSPKTISSEKKDDKVIDQNQEKKQTSKIMEDNYCPACKNPVRESDKKCSNCGLVIKE